MDAEKRRELYGLARRNGWSAAGIGAEIGVKGKAVEAVVRRGSQTGETAPLLDRWLVRYAGTLAGHTKNIGNIVLLKETESRFTDLEDELLLLARHMHSRKHSPEEKARKFESFIFDAAVGLGLIHQMKEK